jgi:hypothetical protein
MPPYKGAKYNKRPLSELELEDRARHRREACSRYNARNREHYNKKRREYMREQYHKAKELTQDALLPASTDETAVKK